jgi:hypothetical protein
MSHQIEKRWINAKRRWWKARLLIQCKLCGKRISPIEHNPKPEPKEGWSYPENWPPHNGRAEWTYVTNAELPDFFAAMAGEECDPS